MANQVQVSKGVLSALVGALVLSSLCVAFLLGKQSATAVEPKATTTPTSPVAQVTPIQAAVQQAEPSLSTRLDRIEKKLDRTSVRLETNQAAVKQEKSTPAEPARTVPPAARPSLPQKVAAQPPVRSVPQEAPADTKQKRAYFQQIDSSLQSGVSVDDPNKFATEFLQQAMSGDTSGFDSLLKTIRDSRQRVQKINPPASCKSHHALLLSQLSQSEALLSEVYQAIASNDTSRLSSVAARGQAMQADTEKYKQLDRDLRRGL